MRQFLRLIKILSTFWRFGLIKIVRDSLKPGLVKTLLTVLSWLTPSSYSRGVSLRLALEALGPIFVKFGQVLSTRRDLLPEDVANELAKLQDQVPPFSEAKSVALIEASLGKKYQKFSAYLIRRQLLVPLLLRYILRFLREQQNILSGKVKKSLLKSYAPEFCQL